MFLEFTTIENWQEPLEELEFVSLPRNLIRTRPLSLWEQMYFCVCGHVWYNHQLGENKCDAEYFGKCNCTNVVFMEMKMEITFTIADLFEMENENHPEKDSPEWWIEFRFWLENEYERKNR